MNCPECDRQMLDEQRSCACGWGRQQAQKRLDDVVRSTYRPIPFGVTKEQCGLILFEVIKTISRIRQLRHYVTLLAEDQAALGAMCLRELAARQQLAILLPQLTDQEDAEIRARYPEVVTW